MSSGGLGNPWVRRLRVAWQGLRCGAPLTVSLGATVSSLAGRGGSQDLGAVCACRAWQNSFRCRGSP